MSLMQAQHTQILLQHHQQVAHDIFHSLHTPELELELRGGSRYGVRRRRGKTRDVMLCKWDVEERKVYDVKYNEGREDELMTGEDEV